MESSLLLPPNHLINYTSIALDQLHDLSRNVLVNIVRNWNTIILVLNHLNSYVNSLEKVVLVDSCENETALVQSLWTLC